MRVVGKPRQIGMVAVVALILAFAPPPASQAGAARAAPATDSIETLVGPGFCTGTMVGTRAATWALALDKENRIFFDTGPRRSGLVGRVDSYGRAKLLVTGVPRGAEPGADHDAEGLGAPTAGRLAPDGTGGVFIASGATIVQIGQGNSLTVVAGDPNRPGQRRRRTSSGDGGPAASARFASARSLVSDVAGNLFVADLLDPNSGRFRVRFLNRTLNTITFYPGTPQELSVPPGHIDTVAGGGSRSSASRGPVHLEALRGISPVLAVANNKLYVTSSSTARVSENKTSVRLINLTGAAVKAHGVAVAAGQIATVAGGGPGEDPEGGGGAARSVTLGFIPGIAADDEGNLYVADKASHRIRRVNQGGRITTFAGAGASEPDEGGFNGNNRPARLARLNRPFDVKVGPSGLVFISDHGNGQVRFVDRSGIIHAAPGSGVVPGTVCTKRVESAEDAKQAPGAERPRPGAPTSVVMDKNGDVYFVAADLRQVKRLRSTGVTETVAGRGSTGGSCNFGTSCRGPTGDGGLATAALLQRPTAIALSPKGQLYVLDGQAGRVRLVNLGSSPVTVHGVKVGAGEIETVAGNGTRGGGGDGGPALDAQLGGSELVEARSPLAAQLNLVGLQGLGLGAIAVDGGGNLLILDAGNHRVRRVDPSGTITTVLGQDAFPGPAGCCRHPVSLVLDAAGNIYLSDLGFDDRFEPHPRVWFYNRGAAPATVLGQTVPPGSVQIVAGTGTVGFAGDGGASIDAELLGPTAMALDEKGSLYLADVGRASIDEGSQYLGRIGYIRSIDREGVIRSIAGDGAGGFNGDGLKPKLTSLNFPAGLAVDHCGNLVIADLGNDRVRRVNLGPPCSFQKAPGLTPPSSAVSDQLLAVAIVLGAVTLTLLSGCRVLRRRSRPR